MASRKATTAMSSASAAKKQRQENSSNDDENASLSLLNRLLNSRRQQLKEQEEEEQHSIDMDTQEEPEEHRQLKMHFTLLLGLADGDYEKMLLIEKAMLQVRRQFTAVDVSRKQQEQQQAQQKKSTKSKNQRSKTKGAALIPAGPKWKDATLKFTEEKTSGYMIHPQIGFSQDSNTLICFHMDKESKTFVVRTVDRLSGTISEPQVYLDPGDDPVNRVSVISENNTLGADICGSIWRLPDGSLKPSPPILIHNLESLTTGDKKLQEPTRLVLDFPYDLVGQVIFQPSGKHMMVASSVMSEAGNSFDETYSMWKLNEDGKTPKLVAKWASEKGGYNSSDLLEPADREHRLPVCDDMAAFEDDYIIWYSYDTSSIHAMAFDGTAASILDRTKSVRLGLNRRRVLSFQPNPIDPSIIALYAHDMVTEDYHIKLVQLKFNENKTAISEIKFFDTKPCKGNQVRWHPDGRHLVYADGGKLNSLKVNIESPSPKLEKIRFTKHNQAGNLIKKVNSTLEDKKSKISKFSFSSDGSAVVTVQDVIVGDCYHHEIVQVTSL